MRPDIGFQIIGFIIAITVHEAAHAFTAYRCGDTTAKEEGRLSLNPMDHVDPFGTVILPLILLMSQSPVMFGWAKPVPINPRNLHDPKTDEYWISLAGPLSNFLLAALFAGLVRLLFSYGDSFIASGWLNFETASSAINFLISMIQINIVLCIFNMIPIPPLDGYHVIRCMLPDSLYENFEIPQAAGFLFFIILISSGATDKIINMFFGPIFYFLIGR
ncbi:MAG TPA: site-2 protease family protein [Candidatus Wallbacteria bacterium]|nr:site-2 protease family protein [Candidatus Wallbacteria bacterium]